MYSCFKMDAPKSSGLDENVLNGIPELSMEDQENSKNVEADQIEAKNRSEAAVQEHVTPCDVESSDEGYGIGSWHPRCLQRMVCPVAFVTLLSLFSASDAFFTGIQVALLTTLETRYGLSAYQIGLFVTINKVGTMLGFPVAAYLGGRPNTHRPRWIAGGAFLMAFGMIATTFPQFIFGPYQYHQSQPQNSAQDSSSGNFDLCSTKANQSDSSDDQCIENTSSDNAAAYVILLISQFVAGVGYAPFRPLAVAYVDDNVKSNRSGFYLGIVSSMYGIGVVLGFLTSSATDLIWVDFYRTETTLTESDPAWVSAWWLLFIFIAFFLILVGIPFLGFPKQLPRKFREEDKDEVGHDDNRRNMQVTTTSADENRSSQASWRALTLDGVKELFHSLWRICTSRSYMLSTLAFVTSGLIFGHLSFFPKYMESQFGLSTSLVNILVAVVIPALAVGSILGGYLCRRWNLQIIGQTKLCLACVCLSVAFELLLFAFGCQNQPVVGINVDYMGNSVENPNLTSFCNRDCSCADNVFQPVCWEANQMTYLSPCHAGCTLQSNTANVTEFLNCTCLSDEGVSTSDDKPEPTPTSDLFVVGQGVCAYQCATLVPFLICSVIFVLLFSTEGPPLILTVVRSVEARDKTFAFGIAKCLQYVIGIIPTPIITGALIDTTCKLWQFECGIRGACWVHDLPSFRNIMAGFSAMVLVLQIVPLAFCWYFLRRGTKYEKMVSVELDNSEQRPDSSRVELELKDQ